MLATHSTRRAVARVLIAGLVAGAAGLAGNAAPAAAVTVRVPQDQPTLQAGINATSSGDTVLVSAGTYAGPGNHDLDFGGRNIVFRSVAGALTTIIDCGGNGRGFGFTSGESPAAVVDGFTVRSGFLLVPDPPPGQHAPHRTPGKTPGSHAAAGPPQNGGALMAVSSSPTIRNCRFTNNVSLDGGAFYLENCTLLRVEGCTFLNNRSSKDGGGILALPERNIAKSLRDEEEVSARLAVGAVFGEARLRDGAGFGEGVEGVVGALEGEKRVGDEVVRPHEVAAGGARVGVRDGEVGADLPGALVVL